MPHVLLERLRHIPTHLPTWDGKLPEPLVKRSDSILLTFTIELSEIIAAVIFVLGSVCFLPSFSKDLEVFLAGCALFIVGAVIYVVVCLITYLEAAAEKGVFSYEAWEHALYTVGSWVFLAGTVLYWPREAHHSYIKALQGCSLGQYFNLFSPEFEGSVLFIIGSLMFAAAAFINALNQRKLYEDISKLLTAITSLYMAGSLLFVIGSVAFLPDLGCNTQMLTIGAWCFIVGSVFYLIGSLLSFGRTVMVLGAEQEEKRGLVSQDIVT